MQIWINLRSREPTIARAVPTKISTGAGEASQARHQMVSQVEPFALRTVVSATNASQRSKADLLKSTPKQLAHRVLLFRSTKIWLARFLLLSKFLDVR
jgi:hypothetical protein